MFVLLVSIVVALFVAMLFLNVYFRVKVFKAYKVLTQNDIKFNSAHFFNKERMEKEVIAQHPEHRESIELFVKYMKNSINMATVLIALITIFGGILLYYRHGIEG
jgi:ABC-type glycerol-3-phosphate transport system permease component